MYVAQFGMIAPRRLLLVIVTLLEYDCRSAVTGS